MQRYCYGHAMRKFHMSDMIAFLLPAACFTTHNITSYDLVSLWLRFFLALVCLMTTLSGRPWTSTWLLWINQHQKLLSYNIRSLLSPSTFVGLSRVLTFTTSIPIPAVSFGVLLTIPTVFLEGLQSFQNHPIFALKIHIR